MTAISLIGPLIASVLYVIVFQKAGFRGIIYVVCICPLLTIAVTEVAIARAAGGSTEMLDSLPALLVPLSLLPLILLAFLPWPPAPVRPSEN